MRRATQGCGRSMLLRAQNPSIPLLYPPDVCLPFQAGPVAQCGCWGSSHHLHIPGSQKEKGRRSIHASFTRKVLGGAGSHFYSPFTGQNSVPRQQSQARRVLSAFVPQVKAGSDGGRGRGLGVDVGSCSLCRSDKQGPALLDIETLYSHKNN